MNALSYLSFVGLFAGATFVGGMGWWVERFLTARFQYRVGPPWYQNFVDVMKLFLKETLIPEDAHRTLFLAAPFIAFSASAVFTVVIAHNYFFSTQFVGDIIVMLYFLVIPSLFVVLGGFASSNPLAMAGATREIKLMLAYEFVFITSLIIAIIKSGGSLTLSGIAADQLHGGTYLTSLSGIIGFILAFFYIQAKLAIIPFDVAEAEQELMAGTMIEYSGPLYGFFRLSKLLLYFSVPLFIIALFWHGPIQFAIIKYIVILLLISVVKNINPRLRVKDALRFFWFTLFPLGLVGIVCALKGW